jgi:hypothetical protein
VPPAADRRGGGQARPKQRDALVVGAAERSWLSTAQTASARRSRQRAGVVAVIDTARTPPGFGHQCPRAVSAHPVRRPGSGCPAVWCPARPVSGHPGSSSGSGDPAGGCPARPVSSPSAVHPSGVSRPVSSRLLSVPVGPVASVSSHLRRWRWGPGRGDRQPSPQQLVEDLWRPQPRAAGSPAEKPLGTGGAAELAPWSVGVSVADPGRVGAGGGSRACPLSDQAGQAGVGAFVAGGGAVGGGAGPGASWPHRPRGCRPRVGWRPRWVVVVAPACQGGHPAEDGARPQRGPGRQRVFSARCRQRCDLRE